MTMRSPSLQQRAQKFAEQLGRGHDSKFVQMLYGLLMRGGDLSGLAKAKYTKPELRERLKNKIMAGTKGGKAGQWSARKAQLLAAEYEKAGGGYRGKKSKKQRSLSTWTKQEWTTESGKPSSETGEAYAPKRAISALKTTAAGRKKLDEANREKKKATKEGRQFARHGLHEGKDRSGTKKGGVTQDEMVLAKAIAIHEEIAKALQSYVHIIKAIGAPAGYEPVPGSKHGGFRKKVGNSYDYWYPSQKHADKDAKHHTKQAKRAKRMLSLIMRLKKTTPEQLDKMLEKLEAHEEHMEGAGSAHKEKDTSGKTKPEQKPKPKGQPKAEPEEAKKPESQSANTQPPPLTMPSPDKVFTTVPPQSGRTQSRTIQPPPLSKLPKFDDMGKKERKKYLDSLAHAFGSHMRRGGYSISNRNYYWGRYLRDGLVEVKNRKYVFTEKFKKQAESAGVKDSLYKGKAMPLGTVRTHGGVLKKKTSEGWVPVKGQKKPKASPKKKKKKRQKVNLADFIRPEIERISNLSYRERLEYVESIPVGETQIIGSRLSLKRTAVNKFIAIDSNGKEGKPGTSYDAARIVKAATNAEIHGGRTVDRHGVVTYQTSKCVGDDADKAYESLMSGLEKMAADTTNRNITSNRLNSFGRDEWAIWNAVSIFTGGNVAACRDNSKWEKSKSLVGDYLNLETRDTRSDVSKEGYANARDTMRSLVARKLDEPVTLYRGMKLDKDLFKELKVGDEIDSRGMASWTKNRNVAREFMKSSSGSEVPIRMVVKKATHGLDVDRISAYPEEEEVVLGGKLILESLKRLPSSKSYEAVFKHVPPKRGKDGLVKASSELQAAFDALFDTSAYAHVRMKEIQKGGPYYGPRGGKWADPDHKIAWDQDKHGSHNHDKRAPEPGTRITKKHKGEEHVIEITEGGYRHHHPDGTKTDYTHKQLSRIASKIAGSSRNGYRFFKLHGENKPSKKDAEKFIKAEVEKVSKLDAQGLLDYVRAIPVGEERYVGSGLRVKKKSKDEFISIDQEGNRSKGKAGWDIIYTVEAASNAEIQGGRSVDSQGTVKYESSRCVGDDADKAYESLFDNLPRQFGGPNLTYSGLNRLGKDEWAIWNAVSLFTQGNVATCRDNSKWRQPTGVHADHLNDRTTGARSDISKQGYANARDTLRSLTARKFDEPMNVYRGMRLDRDLFEKLKVGDEIDSRGIASWTKDPEVAEEFMRTSARDQVPVKMVVKGATHGLDIQFLSNWPDEEEVMLGGKMILEGLKEIPGAGYAGSSSYEAVFKHVPPKRDKDGLVKAVSELQAAFDALFDTSAYDHVRKKKKLTAKGKGVDERVWAEATKLATKQGEGDNFAYVMGIYKRLQGSESVAGGSKKKVPAKNYRVQPLNKAPFIGPRGGKWADAKMTIPYKEEKPEKPKLTPEQMKRVVDKKKRDALMKKYKGIATKFPPAGLSFDLVDANRKGDKIHQGALFTWRDKRGKKQAAYSSEYEKRNGEIKFQRVQQMESKYETAKAKIEATLKDKKKTQSQKDAAAVLLIMAETGLRPGHGGQKHVETFGTKGLMTLHADDVKVNKRAGTVTFDFIGKKKQRNTAVIKNKALAAYLSKNTNSEPGKPLWKSSLGASDLRDGMNSAGLGEFKPYDFRTRLATSKAAEFLSQHGSPPKYSDKEVKAIVKKAAEYVSGILNNTPAVAKSSYIAPAVFESWLSMVQIAKGMNKEFADQIFAAALKRAVKPSGPIEEQTAEEMEMEELEAYPLPSWALDEEIAKAAACPRAAQDVKLNTKNRNSAIKSETIKYGPLNIDEPGDYWSDLADHWDTTEKAAKKSLCGNCVAFDVSPRMEKCMPGEVSDDSGRLGYCWMHHFKCHSARTCYTWAKGGPITKDEVSEDWQERAEMEKSFTSMVAEIIKGGPYIGPRGGKWADPDHKIAWEEDKHGAHKHDKRAPKPGTKITKKHKGEEHVIEVTEGGYRHHHPDGTKKDYTHKQLSRIATNIAGHARNGYRFFKLKGEKPAAEKKPAPSKPKEESTFDQRVSSVQSFSDFTTLYEETLGQSLQQAPGSVYSRIYDKKLKQLKDAHPGFHRQYEMKYAEMMKKRIKDAGSKGRKSEPKPTGRDSVAPFTLGKDKDGAHLFHYRGRVHAISSDRAGSVAELKKQADEGKLKGRLPTLKERKKIGRTVAKRSGEPTFKFKLSPAVNAEAIAQEVDTLDNVRLEDRQFDKEAFADSVASGHWTREAVAYSLGRVGFFANSYDIAMANDNQPLMRAIIGQRRKVEDAAKKAGIHPSQSQEPKTKKSFSDVANDLIKAAGKVYP